MSDKIGIAPLQLREEPHLGDLTTRSLSLRGDSINAETRSIEAVLCTETPVTVIDWRSYEEIDEVLLMRGAKLPAQLPLLESHNRYTLDAVLGSVRELQSEGSNTVGRLYFASDDERIEKIWNKVKQRHITDVSVGYRVLNYVDIPAGQTQEVAGRTFTAGKRRLRIATQWEAKELSLVAIGADAKTKTRQATNGPPASTEALQVPKELRAYLESLGLRAEASEADAWAFYHARTGAERTRADELRGTAALPAAPAAAPPVESQRAAPPATPPAAPPAPLDVAAIQRAERERIDGIRAIAGNADEAIITRAINDGWTVERAAHAILQSERDRRGSGAGADNRAPAGHVRDREGERSADVLGAALMVRSGIALDHPAFANVFTRQALHANRATRFLARDVNDSQRQRIMDLAHRNADRSMLDIARECLTIDGIAQPESRLDVIHLAMRSAVSGGSLSNVYTTAFSAQLLATYQEIGDSTMGWTRESDVPNFQSNERARISKGGGLQKLPRGGSADHLTRSDAAESYKIARYAGQYVVDEQDWIDDRLNWLTDQPLEMAYAAQRLRPDLVYAILFANADMADGVDLFHATHGNTDTGAALADATLRAAIAAMNTLTENSVNLGLQPTHLIVPSALRFTAAQIIRSAEIRNIGDGTDGNNAQFGTYNPLAEEGLRLVSDSRLDNGVIDPNSGTTYSGDANDWFITDARFPAIEVGYLQGTGRRPQVSSWTKSGEDGQWIMGFSVKHDIGAKAIRYASIFRRQG